MPKRKLALAALTTSLAMTLTACGTGNPQQAGRGTTPPTSAVSPTPTTTTAASGPGSVPASPTTTPSNAVIPQSLDQVGVEIAALDNSFGVANSDLTNPQGDS